MRLQWLSERHTADVSWGVHLSFPSADLTEFFGTLGFRWLFLDAQHTPLDLRLCREIVRAADVSHMFCMIRIPAINPPLIESYLDAGVLGILAPNVSSAADARALVDAVKFSPEGTRGASFRSRAARYGMTQSPSEYCRAANRATFTAALIESPSGIQEIEAIASVPGIDYIGIGANDLGLCYGVAVGAVDPRIKAMVDAASTRVKALGKPQISVVSNAEQGRMAVSAGARLIAVSDAALLAGAARSFVEMVGS